MRFTGTHFACFLSASCLLLAVVPSLVRAEDGIYTTTETTTSSTDATSGVTTTRTVTERERPRDDSRSERNRRYWQDRRNDPDRTSDLDARYPYDSTHGENRSDVDAARSGFDDPRNPWDGRYVNDNPRNSANGAGSNAAVNSMRGNEQYRPGKYGTRAVHTR